jgi:cytochrome c-type biogenesis protein CcmF
MIDVGYFALCLALAMAGYAVFASILGARRDDEGLIRSGENAVLAVFGLLSTSVGSLWYAILTHDFQVEYVYENSNLSMPIQYVVASLWGGQNGSVLFWGWVLSVYSSAVVLFNRYRYRALMPYVVSGLAGYSFFFCLLNLFVTDPFQQLPFSPADGRGLNPILQHPYMAIHPPILYAGMVGMSVPFAFAMGALMSGHLDNSWLRAARRWLLIPWTFLGAGNLLGGAWAYLELGWGGYWGWDPVENAAFMPWLAATALLHSMMIQERKGMLKVWNMILVFFTYGMTVFGTFLTRSGVVSSVHSFAQSNVGPFFVVFMAVTALIAISLLVVRLPQLKSENHLESLASRETAFLLNNWILLGILFAVLWGTLFPVLSEAFTGDKITVGAPFFNSVITPLSMGLLLLTGAGPLFAWRRTSPASLKHNFAVPIAATAVTASAAALLYELHAYAIISLGLCGFVAASVGLEFYRGMRSRHHSTGESYLRALTGLLAKSKRRYGGYVVHLSIILLFVGFTGQAFGTDREMVLRYGETKRIRDYEVTFETLAHSEEPGVTISAAALSLHRQGEFLCTLLPERRFYHSSEQNTTEVAIYSTFREDFYLILVGNAGDGSAMFQIYLNPLVNWVWAGGILFVLSSLWTMWPTRRDRSLAAADRASLRDPALAIRQSVVGSTVPS